MKIKSFKLENYGPIKRFSLSPGVFELIFGLNEEGKTAIVEALGYHLFRISSPRYGKPKELSIELEIDGKVNSIPSKKSPRIASPEICRLMYVLASDSAIYDKEKQMHFWDRIKLLLSETGGKFPFTKLAREIRERIDYLPRDDDWKPPKRQIIEKDKMRREELLRYIIEQNEIERKYQNLVQLNDEYNNQKRELDNLQIAKKYSVYQELKKLHSEYLDCQRRLFLYDRYEEEFYEKWQRLEADKKGLIFIIQNQKELGEEIAGLEKEMGGIETKERFIQKQGFYDYLANLKEPQGEPTLFYPFLLFLLGFILLILSFKIGFTLFIPLASFLSSIIALTIVHYKKMLIRRSELKKRDWIARAQLHFPEVKTIDQLRKAIDNLSEEKIKLQTLIDAKREQLEKSRKTKDIEEIDAEIESLRQKTGCAEIEHLVQKLQKKREIKKMIEGIYAKIFNILAEKDERKWAGLIEEKRVEPPEKEYDISRIAEVEERVRQIDDSIREISNEIKLFEELNKRSFNIANPGAAFYELAGVEQRLRDYELEKAAALKAEEILNAMSTELDIFMEEILLGNESLSDYFNFITQRYKAVKIVNREFIAIDEDGNEFFSHKLSSGARDQLMLCFRLSALKRLYPEGTFIILDDAFIFADWIRRGRLAELLKKFADAGNQVLYFTSDNHTMELFKNLGAGITIL